jgi:hypothetical protein
MSRVKDHDLAMDSRSALSVDGRLELSDPGKSEKSWHELDEGVIETIRRLFI